MTTEGPFLSFETAVGPLVPRSQVVLRDFVQQYYDTINTAPEKLHRFYKESSILCRPEADGTLTYVTTRKAIKDKLNSLNYIKADIESKDAHLTEGDGVVILIIGWLTQRDEARKKFAQSIFLVHEGIPNRHSYFVKNDVLRYVEEDDVGETCPQITCPGMTPNSNCVPRAWLVGESFVKGYYDFLHRSPGTLCKYYRESSMLCPPELDGSTTSVTTVDAIREKILSMDYSGYKAVILTVDSYLIEVYGVVVFISGIFNVEKKFKRMFIQSVYLARQESLEQQSYFIKYDIIKYVDRFRVEAPLLVEGTTSTLTTTDEVSSQAPAPPKLDEQMSIVEDHSNDPRAHADDHVDDPDADDHVDDPHANVDEDPPRKSYASIVSSFPRLIA